LEGAVAGGEGGGGGEREREAAGAYDGALLRRVSFLPAPPPGAGIVPPSDYAEPFLAGALAAALWRRVWGSCAAARAAPRWAAVLALAARVAEGASALQLPVDPLMWDGGAWVPHGGADHAPAVYAAARVAECLLRLAPWCS
jgi:hypothetical protein